MNDDLTQWRKGVTEFCLLALLDRQPCHGYELVTRLAESRVLALSESTVYPVLARLKTRGWVHSYSQPSERGPARKVNALTAAGRERLGEWRSQWELLARDVDELTGGERVKPKQEGNP